MRWLTCALIAIASSAGFLHAGSRSSSNYTISSESYGPAGARGASGSYQAEGALGEIGASASSSSYVAKAGFGGQGYSIVGFVLNATPTSVNEGQTRQIDPFDLLDDATRLAVNASSVTWSVLNGPIISVSTSGLATAGIVYQNTNANVQGSRNTFSSALMLSVLNVNNDDFGSYAGDGLDDDWQVQYFGENNPNAGPLVDPDRDGQNNRFEFIAGLVPNDSNSRFALRTTSVAGQPTQKRLIFSPIVAGRTYTPQFRANLVTGSWSTLTGTTQSDNGAERTVTDLNTVNLSKFYRIDITKP